MVSEDIPIIPKPSEEYLNTRQKHDYREHRIDFLEWLSVFGKDPERADGYSRAVVKNTAYRTDKFYRWVWEQEGYTTNISHAQADSYIRDLASSDSSDSHKSKCVKALKRLFKWKHWKKGSEQWDSEITFTDNKSNQPRDFLTEDERKRIWEAALEYGSIPAYNTVTPEERSRWKRYLAQRFGKPKEDVSLDDWERANGWKIPSLVWTSLDAGLRPVEVERATVRWVDLENGLLRMPREEASKSKDNWVIGLREQTVTALDRWITERENYPIYDEADTLWLTREGNPYQTHSLNYLLSKLCEIADISIESRDMSWYSIRHSVGTYMTREEDLAAAAAQLRHKSTQTTMRYDNTPVEDRKKALERME